MSFWASQTRKNSSEIASSTRSGSRKYVKTRAKSVSGSQKHVQTRAKSFPGSQKHLKTRGNPFRACENTSKLERNHVLGSLRLAFELFGKLCELLGSLGLAKTHENSSEIAVGLAKTHKNLEQAEHLGSLELASPDLKKISWNQFCKNWLEKTC